MGSDYPTRRILRKHYYHMVLAFISSILETYVSQEELEEFHQVQDLCQDFVDKLKELLE